MYLRFGGHWSNSGLGYISRTPLQKEVIHTLLVTIIVEGAVGLAYSLWRKKPIVPILITSIFANLLTQSFLWIALSIFFHHYLTTLFIAEILIWIIESVLYYRLRFNQLSVRESLFLSLIMNLSSFAFGLFLPV